MIAPMRGAFSIGVIAWASTTACGGGGALSPPTSTTDARVATTSSASPAASSATPAPTTDEGRIAQKYMAGEYAAAGAMAQALLDARAKASGDQSPTLVPALRALALVAIAEGRADAAIAHLRRSLAISEEWIKRARAALTEAGMAALFDFLRDEEEIVYSLLADRPNDSEAQKLALTVAVLRKGRSLEEVARTFEVFRTTAASSDRTAWNALRTTRARYASLALLGGPEGSNEAELAQLQATTEDTEARLTKGTAFAQLAQGALAMNTAIDLVLPGLGAMVSMGGLYVEVVAFRHFGFGAATSAPRAPSCWGAPEYLALVVKNGGQVTAVPLGATAPIDASARELVAALARPDSDWIPASQRAYRKIVAPLRAAFKYPDIDYVDQYTYLSLDGELERVPLGALHDGDRTLSESYRFTYVTSGRDVIAQGAHAKHATSMLVLADPDFSSTLPPGAQRAAIPPLPGTREEAAALQRAFPKAQVLLGKDATKDALLAADKPGILHVASHGFFVDEGDARGAPESRTRGLVLDATTGRPAPRAAMRKSPLVRSALLLAGSGTQGGVATALEVAGMDLAGTQLVVLSACETARGDVRLGQGVFGLRRALLVAGAETLVMSLWKIDDAATRDLMTTYYRNLSQSQGKVEAMHEASRAIRKTRPHPFYWAPFIVVGKDAVLEGAAGAAIPPPLPRKRGIVVTPVNPPEPTIIGPH